MISNRDLKTKILNKGKNKKEKKSRDINFQKICNTVAQK